MEPVDFTAFRHPVLAVRCPDCRQQPGRMCKRPSGHGASDFHRARKRMADRVFIGQQGPDAAIHNTPEGWIIEEGAETGQPDLFAAQGEY